MIIDYKVKILNNTFLDNDYEVLIFTDEEATHVPRVGESVVIYSSFIVVRVINYVDKHKVEIQFGDIKFVRDETEYKKLVFNMKNEGGWRRL